MKYKVLILILMMLGGTLSADAQCENKISVSSNVNESSSTGLIEVDVKSNYKFTCVLNYETATGSARMEEKKGNGNKTIQFSNLELGKLYSVEVKFSGSKEFLCSKFSKTIIFK